MVHEDYSITIDPMDGGELPIIPLSPQWEDMAPEGWQHVLDEIRQFARPFVIDLGAGSKNVILRVEQIGQDDQPLESRAVLITIGVGTGIIRHADRALRRLQAEGNFT